MNYYAKEWIKALRSGKYQQGKGKLHSGNKFCCLGLACYLNKEYIDSENTGTYHTYDTFSEVLPDRMKNLLGLSHEKGYFIVTDRIKKHFPSLGLGMCSLILLNDGFGFSFNEIADIIELEPEELFKDEK